MQTMISRTVWRWPWDRTVRSSPCAIPAWPLPGPTASWRLFTATAETISGNTPWGAMILRRFSSTAIPPAAWDALSPWTGRARRQGAWRSMRRSWASPPRGGIWRCSTPTVWWSTRRTCRSTPPSTVRTMPAPFSCAPTALPFCWAARRRSCSYPNTPLIPQKLPCLFTKHLQGER